MLSKAKGSLLHQLVLVIAGCALCIFSASTAFAVEGEQLDAFGGEFDTSLEALESASETTAEGEEVATPDNEVDSESGYDDPQDKGSLVYDGNGYARFVYEDGSHAVDSWITFEGKTYRFGPDGRALRWAQTIDGSVYYFNGKGVMHTGWLTWHADGTRSYFGSDGVALTGWQTIDGKTYCFNDAGKTLRWAQTIDGSVYYFNGKGVMHTGWLTWKADGKYSYFGDDGAMLYGKHEIGGIEYDFGDNGKTDVSSDRSYMNIKAQAYSSSTEYLILVDSTINRVGIFKGEQGNWKLEKFLTCTTGALSTPTRKGNFTVGNRGLHFGENKGYTCWYWTQFSGDYLFHSILYNPHSKTSIQDGRLGINASHGCVRLAIEEAKWIYDNIPRGTKVISY